ncbi:chaoptin-like [Agrilus planipennis]|uniref:Chaoptin-like n=1 Tax=Agrilus planipennis TaxID=224129 RepID=A0A1W4WPN6_AGRPL|nr:chaoptin-like [Agrilus planipennis]
MKLRINRISIFIGSCLIWTIIPVLSNITETTDMCSFNSMCVCTTDIEKPTIRTALCLSVPFYKLPDMTKENISHLEVLGSEMTSLETESLTGCQIRQLILPSNKLQYIPDRTFSPLSTSLSSLDLSYNELDGIPFAGLQEVKNLKWMNLYGNQIDSVVGDWSHMKSSLKNLLLGENDVAELPVVQREHSLQGAHGLRQLKSLIWLNLDGNRISTVHRHALPPFLQTLSLSYNQLDAFPSEILTRDLKWLYLRGNAIETFPEHKLQHVRWLEKIDLRENTLTTIPSAPFNSSVRIRDLNLAYNNIKSLTAETFAGLECQRIILSHNKLETMDKDAFVGVEQYLEYLDLDSNNLAAIPDALAILQSLKFLYLSSNSLRDIPANVSSMLCASLKAIGLSGNRFTKIPSEALQSCIKLNHLNMAYNDIVEVNGSDFINWGTNINTLILGNNHINQLRPESFQGLPKIKDINLSFNQIRFIDPSTFVGLDSLENLEMSFTVDYEDVPGDIFKPLLKLKWLSLDNNKFVTISSSAFDFLKHLNYLNLEFNRLKLLPSSLFKTSVHKLLREVRFSYNDISILQTNTFKQLPNLEVILFPNNKIQTIQTSSFDDLPKLTHVILSNNLISKIETSAFANLPSLRLLELQNNILREISFKFFSNVSSSFNLNLTHNRITKCLDGSSFVNVGELNLKHNRLAAVPACLRNVNQLRKLFLDFNNITYLGHNSFIHSTTLEQLTLSQNAISNVNKYAFFGLHTLQILDLSNNFISHLHNNQFSSLANLRIINLRRNDLKYLPKDVFMNTKLEFLDLGQNLFSEIPTPSITEVGRSLQFLSIESNSIERIDSTTFPGTPKLKQLHLKSNKLTILPDNVFTNLNVLQHLDISNNNLRTNFKELFHFAQNLKDLVLSGNNIRDVPHLPLPNLSKLDLSNNLIGNVDGSALQDLKQLRHLCLSHNRLTYIPSSLGTRLPRLKTLDLSYNPIKEIDSSSFIGLKNLQELNILGLKSLKKFDPDGITGIKFLRKLSMQTHSYLNGFSSTLCKIFKDMKQLRILKLEVQDTSLRNQLACLANPKVRQVEITGSALKTIEWNSFTAMDSNPDMLLKITETSVEELPAGLFSSFVAISHLEIDLRNNLLAFLDPDVFYVNYTTWKTVGTTLIKGGIRFSGNSFKCGCHLHWLGHWLRRWVRETMNSQNLPVETVTHMYDFINEATCLDVVNGVYVPIVSLPPEDLNCQASALSVAQTVFAKPQTVITTTLLVCLFSFFRNN